MNSNSEQSVMEAAAAAAAAAAAREGDGSEFRSFVLITLVSLCVT